uniref:Putative Peptidase M50 n=1 Tax=Magnetococcus massalia (strain MO-1) TaxID=451514 RepID=A0A1S7LEB1_MAGMO|nr:putative Peptidase M50 [Candidatus Magnetococcus massalia]
MDALPTIRQELDLYPGPQREDGSRTWTLHDPVRHRFFRIGWLEFELLRHWSKGSFGAIKEELDKSTLTISEEQFEEFAQFLTANQLVDTPAQAAIEQADRMEAMQQEKGLSWMVKNYLFFRIPLFHPDWLISKLYPLFSFLYSSLFRQLMLLVSIIAMVLLARQFDQFMSTFMFFFSMEGMAIFFVTILVSKFIHEAGHALTAKHYGLQVPSMGVAFLVMWPVLYTDTSESWKLTDRFQRLHIASGGILAELTLAVIATLVWLFVPDGIVRSAAFYLATISWVMTLAINLNPFMRFDGYYLLADFLDIDNLQTRAFVLAKWWMRGKILGIKAENPEPEILGRTRNIVLTYAYSTWIYRFFLFLGIALLVYTFFFKVLGILLFVVEIFAFILVPIGKELVAWWGLRSSLTMNRNVVTSTLIIGLFLTGILLPWKHPIQAPAELHAVLQTDLYAPNPGQIAQRFVGDGTEVERGTPLMRLISIDLESRKRQANIDILAIQAKLETLESSEENRTNRQILEQQLLEKRSLLLGVEEEIARLVIRAPHGGIYLDVPEGLRNGLWVNPSTLLGRVVDRSQASIKAYAVEDDLHRLELPSTGRFYAQDPEDPAINVSLVEISPSSSNRLESPYQASTYGGGVAVNEDAEGELVTQQAIYTLRLLPSEGENWQPRGRVVTGTVRLEGKPESLFEQAATFVTGILIRESGF